MEIKNIPIQINRHSKLAFNQSNTRSGVAVNSSSDNVRISSDWMWRLGLRLWYPESHRRQELSLRVIYFSKYPTGD